MLFLDYTANLQILWRGLRFRARQFKPMNTVSDGSLRWADPYTREGVRFTQTEDGLGADFVLHDAGTFVLDKSWNYQGVRSPFWRLYHNTSPGASLLAGGRLCPLTPDLIWVVPSGVTFDCRGIPGPRHLWLHFSPGIAVAHDWIEPRAITVTAPLRALLSGIRQTLLHETSAPARVRHQGLALLHTTFAACEPDTIRHIETRLRNVLLAIERSLANPASNLELAALAQLGASGFARWFKQETGETPAAYVQRRRMADACRRLAFTDASVDQVADALGFANRFHFSRVFKRVLGETPGAFKRRRGPR